MNVRTVRLWALTCLLPAIAGASETEAPSDKGGSGYRLFEELSIVAAVTELDELPGSAHVIDAETLERQGYQDVHRILQQVPGISVQEEDGFGLRPNIGIRGTGVERSSKITMLEDGVLIAPAPYAAPSAYYSPTAGRMEGFEILKGSSAIRQGPYTNGGSINYLSTSIPAAREGRLELTGGSDGHQLVRARAGEGGERFGWLVEALDQRHDGFKRLDGGGPTGYQLSDYLGKFRVTTDPEARRYQALEIKVGRTEQDGDETYLGLTVGDFLADPYRRYASSAGDEIRAEHEQFQLSYELRPSDRHRLTVTAYRNDFFRNWHKLEKVDGVGVAAVLASPGLYADELAVLRGERDSGAEALAVRNNRRDYYSTGVQAVFGVDLERGRSAHELEFGLRLHEDEEDRFQEEDSYRMLGRERIFTSAGAPGSHANRVAGAEAMAAFVQDTIRIGSWTLTPGVRVESIDLERLDYGREDPTRSGFALATRTNSLTEVLPGMGVSYAIDDERQVFVGVHRGFSPPGPSSTEEVDAEESVNFELGYRAAGDRSRGELTAFFSDYENLLGTDTTSGGGGGTGDQFNGGAATIFGLEAGFGTRFRSAQAVMPLDVTYTFTRGEFDSTFESDFADWAPLVEAGDELPYLPEHRLHARFGYERSGFGLFVDVDYTSDVRTRAGSGAISPGERLEARTLVDLRLEKTLFDRWEVFTQLLNATDEVYVAARRPAGLRPGLPRSVIVGLSVDFGGNAR